MRAPPRSCCDHGFAAVLLLAARPQRARVHACLAHPMCLRHHSCRGCRRCVDGREPLGLVFLVVASLSATVFFKPVGAVFNLPDSSIAPGVLALGVGGALLCIVEKVQCSSQPRGRGRRTLNVSAGSGGYALTTGAALYDSSVELEFGGDTSGFGGSQGAGSSSLAYTQLAPVARGSFDVSTPTSKCVCRAWRDALARRGSHTRTRGACVAYPLRPSASFGASARNGCGYVMAALRILPPFLVLSMCYCLWFVFMRFFNDLYRVNAWGFNSYDQVGAWLVAGWWLVFATGGP